MPPAGADCQTELSPLEVRNYYRERAPGLKQIDAKEWRGPCPVHNGKDPNFAVDAETGRWYCHSQCNRGGGIFELEMALSSLGFKAAREKVLDVIGRSTTRGPSHRSRRIVKTYDYVDEQGNLIFQTLRYQPKSFNQRRPHGEHWIYGITNDLYRQGYDGNWYKSKNGTGTQFPAVRRLLYRLPTVLAATTVYITEGEQDVETLEAWGLVGTCNAMGAGKWLPEHAECLRGKDVRILFDNDQPGREHALSIAKSLVGVAASARIVELADLPEKGDVTDWARAGHTAEELASLAVGAAVLNEASLVDLDARWRQQGPVKPPARRPPFDVNDNGVFFLKEGDDGTAEPVRVAARVDVVAKTRDDRNENWGRLLQWRDDENHLHQWAMPMEVLASDGTAVRARLLAEGLPFITTNSRLRERFVEYLQTAPVEKSVRCVARIGWHAGTYVLPDRAIGPEGCEEVLFQSPHEAVHYWNVRGTDDEWREQVGRRCSGNSRLILAAACGFAGPLIGLVGAESGGVHFHGDTTTGKSTGLMVGGSVCGGGGQAGFVQTWRATLNGLEAIAEAHNDGTLFLDELAQVDAREAAETAYLLGNGQGKSRMTRNMGARKKLAWSLLFVSAGELTLAEHARSAGKHTKGGAEVRLLNIEADAGSGMGIFENIHDSISPDAFSRELKDAAQRCHGIPFRTFVRRLTQDAREVEQTVRTAREAFIKRFVPAGAAGEVGRAAHRFALIGAAGELATGWGITGWAEGESIEAAARCLREWIERRGTIGASDMASALRHVKMFLEAGGASRFQPLRSDGIEEALPIRDRAGFRRKNSETGETEYLILTEVFRNEVCAGYTYGAVLKEIDKRGFLIRTPPAMTIKPRLPELGAVRVYCVRAAILEDPE